MAPCRSLLALLEPYAPSCAEVDAHARMLALAASRGDACSRHHFVPGHFTASGFVVDPDGRLLLVHHTRLGRWLQPGGHIDPADPDVLAAARREIAEETGIVVGDPIGGGAFDLDVHPIPPRPGEPAHEHFDVRFLFLAGAAGPTAGDDVHDARWVPLDEVPGLSDDASVLRVVAKLERQRS